MAYAEFWQPIQSAMAGLNQQLNINANRDAERAAAGLNRLMVSEQLENSRFGRDMREAANERAERQLESDLSQRTFTQNMQRDQEARAAARWRLEKPQLEYQKAKAEYMSMPKPINLYNYLPLTSSSKELIYDKPEFRRGMEQLFGGKYDPATGMMVGPGGNPVALTGFEHDDKMSDVEALYIAHLDPLEENKYAAKELYKNRDELNKQMKQIPDGPRGATARAHLKQQINSNERQIDQIHEDTSGEVLLESYGNRIKILNNMMGRTKDPQIVTTLQTKLNSATSTFNMLLKDLYGSAGKGAGAKNLVAEDWKAISDAIEAHYHDTDTAGQWFWLPEKSAMMSHAKKIQEKLQKAGATMPIEVFNQATSEATATWESMLNVLDTLNPSREYLRNEEEFEAFMQHPKTAAFMKQYKEFTGYIPTWEMMEGVKKKR